jgi:cell division protein FtsB
MGVTERVWAALTSMIKLEDKVSRQTDALMAQQTKIENLTERVIRIEAQLELLTGAAMVKKLTRGKGPDLLP